MEPSNEALRLPCRKSELEDATRRPRGIRATEERELSQARYSPQRYPAAVRAIPDASSRPHRPVDALSPDDVESGQLRPCAESPQRALDNRRVQPQ